MPAINKLFENNNLILLQEHWLFQFQLNLLGEICEDICYEGKAVDLYNNIQPAQVPRGYGGTAILWKKEINHLIKVIQDGNERLQCVEFLDNNYKPLLIISAYLPTKGCHDLEEFKENVDQLFEICQKYCLTHDILIGGDINEDISKNKSDNRAKYIQQLIQDCHLQVCSAGNTYVNPKGQECSEIDYFLYNINTDRKFSDKIILDKLEPNTSDHYPISITCNANLEYRNTSTKAKNKIKINWDRIDKSKYQELVEISLANQYVSDNIDNLTSKRNVEEKLTKVSEVLKNSALECIPRKKRKKKFGKLQIWNKNISDVYKEMKKASFKWYEEGKPNNDHPLFIDKKKCKQQFRKTYRIELAIKEINFKDKIMQTRTKDSKTFHMLINKQRRSLRGCIQDLHIDNETMSGEENILQGFKNHFAKLAVPSYDENYNYQYSTSIEQETHNIIELVKNVDILKPTKEELNKALSSIKKGKAADIFDLTVEHFIYGGDALLDYTHSIILAIFESGIVPDMIKEGLLSPVFKKRDPYLTSKITVGSQFFQYLRKLLSQY